MGDHSALPWRNHGGVSLSWGSTWYAIKLQLGVVPEELSVAYRFALAGLCLLSFSRISGRQLAIARDDYPAVVLQGLLMFSLSYMLVYVGSRYITTGLVAVLYSLIIIFNGIFEWVFYRRSFDRLLLGAAAAGLCGTALVFWQEVSKLSLDDEALKGIAWTVGSIIAASLGNMAAIRNTERQIPIVLINAHGMLWGALLSVTVALLLGRPLVFSPTWTYAGSLVYLAIAGSCIAFGGFMLLIKHIGASRASYVSILFPVVALGISTLLEDYRWTISATLGVGLILAGNWLALSRRPKQ